MKKLAILLVILFPLQILAQETIEKSFDNVEHLKVNLSSGDCTLKKGSGNSVEILVSYSYSNDVFQPEFKMSGSTLIIKEKFDGNSGRGFSKWELTIPDNLDVQVNSGSGDLSASNLRMDLDSNSGSGDLFLSNTDGDVRINRGSGDVEIENQKGSIRVNTGSGDIEFSGSGDVDINAGSGSITVNNSSATFRLNVGSGDIRARGIEVTGASSFNTGSGDATIMLAKPLTSDISINSGSGDSELDFNNFDISGNIRMKANKRNGEIRAPFEFDKVEEEHNGNQTVVIKTAKIGTQDVNIQVTTGSGLAEIKK